MSIEFFVPGKAKPGGSKTYYPSKTPGKKGYMAPAGTGTKPWMNTVRFFAMAAYQGPLLLGPLKLTIEFRRMRPGGHYLKGNNAHLLSKAGRENPWPTPTPDLTKLTRALEDALKGIAWRDDSQVCIQETRKVYVDRDPGAMVRISEILACKEVMLFDETYEELTK